MCARIVILWAVMVGNRGSASMSKTLTLRLFLTFESRWAPLVLGLGQKHIVLHRHDLTGQPVLRTYDARQRTASSGLSSIPPQFKVSWKPEVCSRSAAVTLLEMDVVGH